MAYQARIVPRKHRSGLWLGRTRAIKIGGLECRVIKRTFTWRHVQSQACLGFKLFARYVAYYVDVYTKRIVDVPAVVATLGIPSRGCVNPLGFLSIGGSESVNGSCRSVCFLKGSAVEGLGKLP